MQKNRFELVCLNPSSEFHSASEENEQLPVYKCEGYSQVKDKDLKKQIREVGFEYLWRACH